MIRRIENFEQELKEVFEQEKKDNPVAQQKGDSNMRKVTQVNIGEWDEQDNLVSERIYKFIMVEDSNIKDEDRGHIDGYAIYKIVEKVDDSIGSLEVDGFEVHTTTSYNFLKRFQKNMPHIDYEAIYDIVKENPNDKKICINAYDGYKLYQTNELYEEDEDKNIYGETIEITIGSWDEDGAQHGHAKSWLIVRGHEMIYKVIEPWGNHGDYQECDIIEINGVKVWDSSRFLKDWLERYPKVKEILDSNKDVKEIGINLMVDIDESDDYQIEWIK